MIPWHSSGATTTVHHLAKRGWMRTLCGKPITWMWLEGPGGHPLCVTCAGRTTSRPGRVGRDEQAE
jgi:hypothetical protein